MTRGEGTPPGHPRPFAKECGRHDSTCPRGGGQLPSGPKTIAFTQSAGPHAPNGAGPPCDEHLCQCDFGVGRGLAGERADLALFTDTVARVNGKAKGAARAPPSPRARPPTYSKSQHGLPQRIEAGHAAEAWADITSALHAGKKPPQGTPAGGRQASDGPTNERNRRGALP
jgi:hypothetical protein